MSGRVALKPEASDIPEFDLEVDDLLQPQRHSREDKTAGSNKKKPFGRPDKKEEAPQLPQFGREVLSNPMAQVGLEYTKK